MIDGPNLYAYVTNDPINYIDPMGTAITIGNDPGIWEDDINIPDPISDIFDAPSGSPELDDIAMSDPGPINSGQSGGDCELKKDKKVLFVGFGTSGTVGTLKWPWDQSAQRGYAIKGDFIGIAYETHTGDYKFYKSYAESDYGDEISGFSLGIGVSGGVLKGDFEDFFGRARENTGNVVISHSEIQTETGAEGVSIGIGKGIGVSSTNMDIVTEEIFK